jgi:hypothetical protein
MAPKKSSAKLIGMPWDFSSLMNEAIRCLPERAMQKRSHIWSSEIGGDFTSRYLKMHAHPYSNPPNDRSRRKFISGHCFEWIVQLILTMCGVLKEKQLRAEIELPGMLRVTGKLDFIAGGVVDWEKARADLQQMQKLFATAIGDMPPIVFHSVDRVLFRMEQMFSRVPLQEMIIESKSISGFMFDLVEKTKKMRPGHAYQTLTYVLANKIPGAVVYINKDSFMCQQFEVLPTKPLVKEYHDDIRQMTEYYNASGKNYLKNMPPKAPEVYFMEDDFRFMKDFHIEYSPYLTMLYGYEDFEAFRKRWQPKLIAWNRVFKRCVRGDNITAANKIIISEVEKEFPMWDKYVQLAKKKGVFDKAEEVEDEI